MADTRDFPTWPGWETVRLIGRGSFGAVYEIRRDVLGNTEKAALKHIRIPENRSEIDMLFDEGYDDASVRSTFRDYLKGIVDEYSLTRRMNGSANVVNCEDVRYEQQADGFGWDIYIKMELLTPLTKSLGKEIPDSQVVRIGTDICKALVLCRKHNIIHRDIKPANIFVSDNGDYKLGDFGIAKTVEKTSGGTKIGTYEYMAPEVYNNRPYGSGADIYSLGMVLYWLLNEKRTPFLPLPPTMPNAAEKEAARARRFYGETIPAPAHGSPELRRIVGKACAFDPKDRYQSAEELLRDLEALGRDAELRADLRPAPPIEAIHEAPAFEEATVDPPSEASDKAPLTPPAGLAPSSGQDGGAPQTENRPAEDEGPKDEDHDEGSSGEKSEKPKLPEGETTAADKGAHSRIKDRIATLLGAIFWIFLVGGLIEAFVLPINWEWSLRSGVLTVSGIGPTKEVTDSSKAPWWEQRSQITSVEIQFGITSIGHHAFYDCANLTDVTMENSVFRIRDYAFQNCTSLRNVTFSNRLKTIGHSAFDNCTSLTSLHLPESVKKIEAYAFSKCNSLTEVYYAGTEAQWKSISIGNYNDPLLHATIHYNSK